jgi:hypothetical protein
MILLQLCQCSECFSVVPLQICGLKPNFTMQSRLETAVAYIRNTVKDGHVLVLVSGGEILVNSLLPLRLTPCFVSYVGVDSSVCAALLKAALKPEQVMFAVLPTPPCRLFALSFLDLCSTY